MHILRQDSDKRAGTWLALGELLIIALWALWVGRDYLDFDPNLWPAGKELGMVIRTHYVWTLLPRCGDCMLWNGFINGGAPAFAELQGAVLHPLVVMATLVWGGINGTKVVLLASLIMAGGAQWWLARVMGLGRLARLWSAAMAVVGGHLAGRMEHGVVGLVLSTAACSLVLAPALDWVKTRRRRSAILLGVTLAGALLSGQVYVQLALFLGVFPALGLYALDAGLPRRRIVKGLLLALVLALLLTAVFWVPLVHFLPNFGKDIDPDFTSVQPLEYLPLNLVIRDLDFYIGSQTLGRWPYPYLYVNYVGWIPILLAAVALRFVPRSQRRQLYTLLLAIALVYLSASATILRWLRPVLPDVVARIRYISVSSGLAVPLVLALAAWGLDLIWQWMQKRGSLRLPRLRHSFSGLSLLLVPLLAYSGYVAYDFNSTWIYTLEMPAEVYVWVDRLQTDSAQWVSPVYGVHFWTPPALEAGLKLTEMVSPWRWEGREYPPAYRELIYDRGMTVQEHSEHLYASVETTTVTTPCHAASRGGHIDVVCTSHAPGVLTVKENNWTGWYAWRNGTRIPIDRESDWLTVQALAGENHFTFRYRPWDVPLGLVLTLVGMYLSVLLWLRPVRALPALTLPGRWLDRGVGRIKGRARRLLARLPAFDFSDRRLLRYCAWLLNALAGAALLAIFGLRWWLDLSPDAPIMKYLVAILFVAALAGPVILLQVEGGEEKDPAPPVADDGDRPTNPE